MGRAAAWQMTLALAGGGLLCAEGLVVEVKNQSWSDCLTLARMEDKGQGDVRVTVHEGVPLNKDARPASSQDGASTWALGPGQWARIATQDPPKEWQEALHRTFKLSREEEGGECRFTYRATVEEGQPRAVLEFEPNPESGMALVLVRPDLLVYCGAWPPGLGR